MSDGVQGIQSLASNNNLKRKSTTAALAGTTTKSNLNAARKPPTTRVFSNEADMWTFSSSSTASSSSRGDEDSAFCVPWTVNSDNWWTHHVEWEVYYEYDDGYCFRRMEDGPPLQQLKELYKVQFLSDCSQVLTKPMANSGYGTDMMKVIARLRYALAVRKPVQIQKGPWHYASPKPFNISTAACPTQDMFCFFLPISNCTNQNDVSDINTGENEKDLYNHRTRYLVEYAARPQTWLRKRTYDFTKLQLQRMQQPCTVMHVRRADVVLHKRWSRAYHSIQEYLNSTSDDANKTIEPNILLLTDDHNAIGEAKHEFPKYNWMYIERKRYRGSEGGWEQQLPSQDPTFEMVVLLSTFRLVKTCNSIIKSYSRFGAALQGEVIAGNQSAWIADVDALQQQHMTQDLLAGKNSDTVTISKNYDDQQH